MTVPLIVLAAHFIGDFVLQSEYMAVNKSRSWRALAWHVTVYAACFIWWGPLFVALTWTSHLATDAVTSRISARLSTLRTRHWFYVALGADQLVHATTLALTLQYCSNSLSPTAARLVVASPF